MARPSFIVLWIFITAFVVCPLYAQNTGLLSQPIIHGEVNGMKVMAQGDAVAFMASRYYSMELDGKACARDLHCTMQKNRTEVVVLNPEGILIIDSPSKELPSNVTITESLYPVFTEVIRLSSTAIKPTTTYVPLEFPQPTATLHTGNEVVDKTPGILLVSSPVITWLAETVTTVSHSRQVMDSGESLTPIIEPMLTQQKAMLTTITEEEDELLRKLTSTSAMPTPTPTLVENRLWEDGTVRLEIETDSLTIKPSPSYQTGNDNKKTNSLTFTLKQVPTNTGNEAKSTITPKETNSASPAKNGPSSDSSTNKDSAEAGSHHSPSAELQKRQLDYENVKKEVFAKGGDENDPYLVFAKYLVEQEVNSRLPHPYGHPFRQKYPNKEAYVKEWKRRAKYRISQGKAYMSSIGGREAVPDHGMMDDPTDAPTISIPQTNHPLYDPVRRRPAMVGTDNEFWQRKLPSDDDPEPDELKSIEVYSSREYPDQEDFELEAHRRQVTLSAYDYDWGSGPTLYVNKPMGMMAGRESCIPKWYYFSLMKFLPRYTPQPPSAKRLKHE